MVVEEEEEEGTEAQVGENIQVNDKAQGNSEVEVDMMDSEVRRRRTC